MTKRTRREVLAGAAAASVFVALPAEAASEPIFMEDDEEAGRPELAQYGYVLHVHAGDHDALQAALVHYQQICEIMVANGHSHPFASNRLTMSNMLRQTSAANAEAVHEFCEYWDKKARGAAVGA